MALLDWMIVALYALGVTMGAGLYVRKHVRHTSDFLVAGRRLKFYLGIAALTSAELGLITVMALAETGFKIGFTGLTPDNGFTG